MMVMVMTMMIEVTMMRRRNDEGDVVVMAMAIMRWSWWVRRGGFRGELPAARTQSPKALKGVPGWRSGHLPAPPTGRDPAAGSGW